MEQNELTHYGVKGMKWGVRRYQNKDGTLTAKGKKRYSKLDIKDVDAQLQKNYGASKLGLAGQGAGFGVGFLGGLVGSLTGNPALAIGAAYVGNLIAQGTTVASVAKYYRDGHKFVHKYDKG